MGKEGDKTNTYEESLLVAFLLLDQCSVSYLYNLIFQPKQNKGNVTCYLHINLVLQNVYKQSIRFFQIFISLNLLQKMQFWGGVAQLLLQFFVLIINLIILYKDFENLKFKI